MRLKALVEIYIMHSFAQLIINIARDPVAVFEADPNQVPKAPRNVCDAEEQEQNLRHREEEDVPVGPLELLLEAVEEALHLRHEEQAREP